MEKGKKVKRVKGKKVNDMAHFGHNESADEHRREELIRLIEHSVEQLTLPELEALYYDMTTKNFIADE